MDLRGHGDSHDVEPFHTVDACARDVIDLVMELELDVELVIGHSFGGKIALEVARRGLLDSSRWPVWIHHRRS